MKRVLMIAAGALGGLLVAGLAAPALVASVPSALRGQPLLLGTASIGVALAAWGTWYFTLPPR